MQLSHNESKLIAGVVLADFEQERVTTMRVIAAIPEGQEGYSPDSRSMGALKLAFHIAASELYFLELAEKGSSQVAGKPMPESIRTAGDVNAWSATHVPDQVGKVKALPGEALSRTVTLPSGAQMSAIELLRLMLKHSIHHRGQLSAYLRPMGAKVPAIYGQSGDTK